jgi:hypothetical protein
VTTRTSPTTAARVAAEFAILFLVIISIALLAIGA